MLKNNALNVIYSENSLLNLQIVWTRKSPICPNHECLNLQTKFDYPPKKKWPKQNIAETLAQAKYERVHQLREQVPAMRVTDQEL